MAVTTAAPSLPDVLDLDESMGAPVVAATGVAPMAATLDAIRRPAIQAGFEPQAVEAMLRYAAFTGMEYPWDGITPQCRTLKESNSNAIDA